MFNSRIVFVLGAGAGHEIGMPVGRTLADIPEEFRQRLGLKPGLVRA
jgi:hypothetical protein